MMQGTIIQQTKDITIEQKEQQTLHAAQWNKIRHQQCTQSCLALQGAGWFMRRQGSLWNMCCNKGSVGCFRIFEQAMASR